MSGPIPLEIFGDDPSLVEDAPADIAPSNKTYKKGDLVWYKQRDGAVVSAKVCSVDASVQPPSYGIELGNHFRETEASRLAPRGSGATPSSQPAASEPAKQPAPAQPAVQSSPSSPIKQSAPSQPANAATSPKAAAIHQATANGHQPAAKQSGAQPQAHHPMPSSPARSQQSQQSLAQLDGAPRSPLHAGQRQPKAGGVSPQGSPRGSPKGHHRAGHNGQSGSSNQSHLQPHQQLHQQPHQQPQLRPHRHQHNQQRPHHQPSYAQQQEHHHQSSPRSHHQSHPRPHHQPQHQTQQHAQAQQDRAGAANYYFNPYMAQMTPDQQRQYLRQYMVAANPSMQGLTSQQQDAYLQQYMQAMQGYQSQQQQQQPQQQGKSRAGAASALQQGHPQAQQQQQQQAQPLAQTVDPFQLSNQTRTMQAKQQQQQPADDEFGTFGAAADDEFGTFEEAATLSAPTTIYKPVYDRSAPVPASIFGDDIPEAEDAPLPPLSSQPRLAAGSHTSQQAPFSLPPQSLPVPSAQASFEQQPPSVPATPAVHHHPFAPSGPQLNDVLGLGTGRLVGALESQNSAEAEAAEGDDDWGDEWVGSGSPAAAAAAAADAEVPRPSPFAAASMTQPAQPAVAAARAAGAAAAEADVHAGADGRQKPSDALPAITLGAPLPTPWATRSSSIDAREPSSIRPNSRPTSSTDRKAASNRQPLSLAIFGDEALEQMDAADLQPAATGKGPKIDTTPWGLNTELRQRESEGGEDEDIEPDREKDEGWVSAGMRKVMGGRRGSLLKRLGSGRLGAGLEQDQDEAMPQPASTVGGPSRFRYLAAWTRLMQACAKELERGSFAWQQMCHTGDPQEWMEEESGHAYLAGLGHIYFVVSLLRAAAEHYHADTHSPEFAAASERCDAAWTAKADAEGAFSLQVAVIMALNHPEATRVGGLGLPFEDLITLPSEAAKQLPISDPGAIHRHSRETGQKLCAFSLLPLEGLQEVPHVRWVDGQPCLVPLANLWMNRVSDESLLLH